MIEQKVLVFQATKKRFSTAIDFEKLNEFVASLNADGWRVIDMQANHSHGTVFSYTLLVERGG